MTTRRMAKGRHSRRPIDNERTRRSVGDAGGALRASGWPELVPGTALTVVKLAPDGSEVARYPGTVIEAGVVRPWIAVRATWQSRILDLDGLLFVPGDTLHEYFSPKDRFNAFAVFAPDGTLRGWYANVTHPAALHAATDPPTLRWHDLYLDVVALPTGTIAIRDEDELVEAAVADRNPALHAAILATRDEILDRLERRVCPFHDGAAGD